MKDYDGGVPADSAATVRPRPTADDLATRESLVSAALLREGVAFEQQMTQAMADARPLPDDLNVRPVEQRLDRLALAHDQLYSDLAALAYALAPVLPDGPLAAEGDDQPEEPRPASPLAQRLQKETAQAEHLAAKVRAITKAIDL